MCEAIGVDPLAASVAGKAVTGGAGSAKGKDRGGWWALWKGARGDEGDLLLRLAISVVGICRASRSQNGGLLGVAECREMVRRGQRIGGEVDVTE